MKIKTPMDENGLAQLAAARELAVNPRLDKADLKQKEKKIIMAEAEAEAKAKEVEAKLKRPRWTLHQRLRRM